ncbi:hypothetical protein GGS26DRAFT_597166 [Hypomontagnella submonticulosa]|nr:hypothetical protein GGS26DRAFT_597166 [Hypomontagnella submonticulosa]
MVQESILFGMEDDSQAIPEIPLYEELNPDFEDVNGGLKTNNLKGNRWQRRFVHISDKESKFRKTVETVLVVHGWKTPAKTDPMTLVILSVSLDCHARDFRFQSVRMWLGFDEDHHAEPPNTEEAAPEVVAYAPFVAPQSWDTSEEEVEKTSDVGGTAGAEYFAKADVEFKKEVKRSFTRSHFDRGSADWMVDDNQRTYGVNWYCEQNELQKFGVKPQFHIAVLLKRQHTKAGNPISFSGIFDMRTEAGFIHDFEEKRRRIFRLGKPEDEAMYYHPDMDDQLYGLNNAGEAIRSKIDKENLGKLIGGPDGLWLSSLIDPTGNLSGLKPIQPKIV